ncbi:hypothetical protein ACROYT_G024996 [Oculina patagonica]
MPDSIIHPSNNWPQAPTKLRQNLLEIVLFVNPCDPGWAYFNKSCYKLFPEPLLWAYAKGICEQNQAYVASFQSEEEQSFVSTNILPEIYEVWIGLYDRDAGSSRLWIWEDGTGLSFSAWGDGQPNKLSSRCVSMINGVVKRQQWNHEWNDRGCDFIYAFGYVCERKSEP